MKTRAHSAAELLEARIAPATLVNKVLTYTDADGDAVTIKFTTKGPLAEANFVFDSAFATAGPQQLRTIDLSSDPRFKGSSFTMTVTAAGGDGDAHIGFVNATGIDLGNVTIDGDLGRIVAGDATTTSPAIKQLKVNSLGVQGTATQEDGGTLDSVLTGPALKSTVAGDVQGAFLRVLGGANGRIGTLTIGGDLVGGDAANSGKILTEGAVASVRITGSIVGGAGMESGRLDLGGKAGSIVVNGDVEGGTSNRSGSILGRAGIGSLTIGGSVTGGASGSSGIVEVIGALNVLKVTGNIEGGGGGALSGSVAADVLKTATIGGSLLGSASFNGGGVFAGTIGTIKITGDLRGGTGDNSGQVFASGTAPGNGLKSISVGGSIVGGAGLNSALVGAALTLGTVNVALNVEGGAGNGSGTIFGGSIKAITVGTMKSGTGEASGGVQCDGTLGKLTIIGSAIGTVDDPLVIAARGGVKKTATADKAIGTVIIGGNATAVNIMAGYRNILNSDVDRLEALNEDAQIGSVTVEGSWTAGQIVAGVRDVDGDGFGDADDAQIVADTDGIIARIGSIVIKGTAEGFLGMPARPFAFTAQQIGSVKIGLVKAALTTGADDLPVPGATATDFRIREVPLI